MIGMSVQIFAMIRRKCFRVRPQIKVPEPEGEGWWTISFLNF